MTKSEQRGILSATGPVVSFDDYRRSTALLLQANVAPIFYPCCSN